MKEYFVNTIFLLRSCIIKPLFSASLLRVEEAEGVGEPCDTDQLSLNPCCTESKLLRGLWATAVLLGPNSQ